jgi:hypothetical protein
MFFVPRAPVWSTSAPTPPRPAAPPPQRRFAEVLKPRADPARIALMGQRLHIAPRHLVAVMWFESRLDPRAKNPLSGASGLVQMMPSTAGKLLGLPPGEAVKAVREMGMAEQLDLAERYFEMVAHKRPLTSLRDVYMAVFWPAAIGQGPDYVIAREGSIVYEQNAGLDANKDGVLTAGEAAQVVEGAAHHPEARTLAAEAEAFGTFSRTLVC